MLSQFANLNQSSSKLAQRLRQLRRGGGYARGYLTSPVAPNGPRPLQGSGAQVLSTPISSAMTTRAGSRRVHGSGSWLLNTEGLLGADA